MRNIRIKESASKEIPVVKNPFYDTFLFLEMKNKR